MRTPKAVEENRPIPGSIDNMWQTAYACRRSVVVVVVVGGGGLVVVVVLLLLSLSTTIDSERPQGKNCLARLALGRKWIRKLRKETRAQNVFVLWMHVVANVRIL